MSNETSSFENPESPENGTGEDSHENLRKSTNYKIDNLLEGTHISIPENTSYGLLMMARNLKLPLEKEYTHYPVELYQRILKEAFQIPHLEEVAMHIRKELLSDLLDENYEGSGYVVVDGLYNNNIYSNTINPKNLLAEQLAPLDQSKTRAYEFNTDLCSEQLKVAMIVTCLCGVPYRMFNAKKFIIPVTSYESLDPTKFGGIGVNLLHKDGGFLSPLRDDQLDPIKLGPATDVSSLLCINSDNTGKGKSWIVKEDVEALRRKCNEEEVKILESAIFSYIPAHGLNDAIDLERFPIFYTDYKGKQRMRFSGKLIQHLEDKNDILDDQHVSMSTQDIIALLKRLNDAMMQSMSVFPLQQGQLFISNQHSTFHGREEVHDQNRILAQFFNRVPHKFGASSALEYSSFMQ
jgi:hypothetical protein